MQKQIKGEIVIYQGATLPTQTTLPCDAICLSRQYESMCEAMYDTVIEYDTELEDNEQPDRPIDGGRAETQRKKRTAEQRNAQAGARVVQANLLYRRRQGPKRTRKHTPQ